MFEIVKKLLMARQLRMERGRLTMLNQTICMIPVDTLFSIQKELEKIGKENTIYLAGKNSGYLWFVNMAKNFKVAKKDIVKWGVDIISLAGFGNPIIVNIDTKNKKMIIDLENSTLAEKYKGTNKPIDHLFRGFIAGAGKLFFNVETEAIEIKCKAKGARKCEFIVKKREDFNFSDKLVKQQLHGVINK